jgi:hypothetical protein
VLLLPMTLKRWKVKRGILGRIASISFVGGPLIATTNELAADSNQVYQLRV